MIVKARIEHNNEYLFQEEVSDAYSPDHSLSEKLLTIKKSPIGMSNYQISANGLFLIYSEMKFDATVNILTEVEGDAVASQFIFSRQQPGMLKKTDSSMYRRSRHNIRFISSSTESHEVKPDIEYIYFMIVLSKDYFRNLIDLYAVQEQFGDDMQNANPLSFAGQDLFVTPAMRKSIEEIRACKHEGELKWLFTNARIQELIMFQLEQFSHHPTAEKEMSKDLEISKLEQARDILHQEYINPPDQKMLSKRISLNQLKLKSGFKEYFGCTIYTYITRLRMEEARRLILSEGKNMFEVGLKVGFKHQASFTHAFKKYYGILPSEIKV